MKKILSMLLACTLLIGVMLMLVSCGGLSGTYEGDNVVTLFDLKFKGDKVTVILGDNELKGTYEISEKDGKEFISFDFVDEDEATGDEKIILKAIDKLLGKEVSMTEKDGKLTIATIFEFKKK